MNKISFKDRVLAKFAAMPGATANEVAIRGLMAKPTQVASAAKRAHDLSRRACGFLIESGARECSESGHDAMTYKVSELGLDYLRAKGIPFRVAGAVAPKTMQHQKDKAPAPRDKANGLAALAAARAQLA